MGRDPVESDLGISGVEPALAEGVVAQVRLSAHPEEDRLRSWSTLDLLLKHDDEELGDWDGAVLVVLRRLDALVALVGDDGLFHLEAGAGEVEILDTHSRQLAPAESAICHQQDGSAAKLAPVRSTADREGVDLIVTHVALRGLDPDRKREALWRAGSRRRASSRASCGAPESTLTNLRTVSGEPGIPAAHSCACRRVNCPIWIGPSRGRMWVLMIPVARVRLVDRRSGRAAAQTSIQSLMVTRVFVGSM